MTKNKEMEIMDYYLTESVRLMKLKHILVEKDKALCSLKNIGKKETKELENTVSRIIQINNELLIRDSEQVKTIKTLEREDEKELNDIRANERLFNRFFMAYREYVNKNSRHFENLIDAAKASEKNRRVLEVFVGMLKQGLRQAIRFKKLIIEEEHNELSRQSRVLMFDSTVAPHKRQQMLRDAEELANRFLREKEVFDTIILYSDQLNSISIALDIIEKEEEALIKDIKSRTAHERIKLRLPRAA